MVLTFAEDFSGIVLDDELTGIPDSGLYWNRGVLPFVTVANLLDFLPLHEHTISDWQIGNPYTKFETSKNVSGLTIYEGSIYQSLVSNNLENQPDNSTAYWLKTNIESLRIKSFIWSVTDNMISNLSLSRKLVENQYIYNVSYIDPNNLVLLPNNYSAWVFEPKGSDYIKIRINQIALQANTSDSVSLYVINQGVLKETITLTPNNGILSFEDVDYTITGKGKFIFAIDSQYVYSNNAYNDALSYDGFICYPVTGIGDTPEGASYSQISYGNGLNFNVSAYLDSSQYLTNNLVDFAKLLQSQFEMDFIQMMQFNSNTRSSSSQRILTTDKNMLAFQSSDLSANTAARRYANAIKEAKESVNRTFDKFLKSPTKFKVRRSTL